MFKEILSVAVLGLGLSATLQAEVKPKGTILLSECGTLNRSVEICTATVEGSKTEYLVFTGFAYRNLPLKGVYLKATVKDTSAVGSLNKTYSVYSAKQSGNYVTMVRYDLETSRAVVPDAKTKAQLKADGVNQGPALTLEPRYHTESL